MSDYRQQGEIKQTDVLIIGAGVAGLSYAISLARLAPAKQITIIAKTDLTQSNSQWAQGGIAIADNNSSAIQSHITDTLQAGSQKNFLPAVEAIINQGPAVLAFLESIHVDFTQSSNNGQYARTREGGHSESRIYYHGDTTGKALMTALIKALDNYTNINILTQHTAVNLITQQPVYTPGIAPEVIGSYSLDNQTGLIHTVIADVCVLATGGSGKVFRYTSNPDSATGDGIAMAYRAGARIRDMEFYQFHPTLLYHQTENNYLISEALRGEGGRLLTADKQQPFMQRYHPNGDLATRDIVARAIFTEIERSHLPYVYLDMTQLDSHYCQQRFPGIYQKLLSLGIDMTVEPIPVVPGAHYQCGGVLADSEGKTDLTRLYALGECACTGLHGANRLASNSLLEGIAMALNAVKPTLSTLSQRVNLLKPIEKWQSTSVIDTRRASQINSHWRGLRGEMMSYAGIVRTEAGLQDLLELIKSRKKIINAYYWQYSINRDVIELRNIITIAELITQSALNRKQSCGGHFREDSEVSDVN